MTWQHVLLGGNMRKLTAIILSAILIVISCPFIANAATPQQIDTAEQFMNVSDGHYVLGADIDLTSVNWSTVSEFSGVLNGNGHTITVPNDAPIFDTLTGVVKNVKLDGAVTLDAADASSFYTGSDNNSYPVGVLANCAVGATVTNLASVVNVTFDNSNTSRPQNPSGEECGISVGGLIGFACGAYTIDSWNDLTVNERTVIKNVWIGGTLSVEYGGVTTNSRDNVGGIIGTTWGHVDISKSAVSSVATISNSCGNKGGFVGYVHQSYKTTADAGNNATTYMDTFTECLFNGTWTMSGSVDERFGGIVGYGLGVFIKSCAHEGKALGAGTKLGILGYANSSGTNYFNIVDGCIAVGENGCGTYTNLKCESTSGGLAVIRNMYVISGNTLNGSNAGDNVILENNTTYTSKESARLAFVSVNPDAFECVDGVISLKNVPDFDFVLKDDNTHELSTGISKQTGLESEAPYAGYIQFARTQEGKVLARLVMVVSDEELANPDYDEFSMKVTVGDKTVTLSSRAMAAFKAVSAAGTEYTAAQGYHLFGVVISFDTAPDLLSVELESPNGVIMYRGSAESTNLDMFLYVAGTGTFDVVDWNTIFGS